MQFIDLNVQLQRIRPLIDEAIKRVLDHGQYIMGPEVGLLEEMLSEFVGVKHAIGCSSGTDALLLPLLAYGVGPGDAIFTTPFTFFATCEMISLTGATPVFVDIDPETYNIDPQKLEDAIVRFNQNPERNGKTLIAKGIIPVDLYGQPADYDAIMKIANKFGLFVLEDAAQAFGSSYKGRKAPGLGHVGATSFFPAKPLGCYGDGGAVFTDDDEMAEVIRSLVLHGKGDNKYNNVRIGLNARLDTLQAAILIEKLKIYPEEIKLRQEVASRYTKGLESSAYELVTPRVPEGITSVWAQYTVRSEKRDQLQTRLTRAGIPSMVYYSRPVHLLDATSYLGGHVGDFPIAEASAEQVMSLPMHPYITEVQQLEVLQTLIN